MKVPKKSADHIIATISGVLPDDTRLEAANKAIAIMRSAGFSTRQIRKAEAIRDEIARRDGK